MSSTKPIPIAVDSFTEDALGLQPFAKRLESFMLTERHFVDGALVVSLGAPFGSGKTTFLKMWKSDLQLRRKEDPLLPYPMILNAWESDFCGDPFLAVISELVHVVETILGKQAKESASFRDAAKQAAWFGLGLANSFVSNWSGLDAISAGELATGKTARAPDILSNYHDRLTSLNRIRAELDKNFGNGAPGALIMVDELDRCRPEYAIGYLETIKHVFGIKGLMFVLAVDSDRLAVAAQTVFGQLNFDEFYRKFVHRSTSLPTPDEKGCAELIGRYVNQFIEREGLRVSFAKIQNHHLASITEFMRALRMTPRQTQEVLRIVGHVLTGTPEKRGQLLWCLISGTLLLSIIRVGDSKMFTSIKQNAVTLEQFGAYLIGLLGSDRAGWWFSLYLTGLTTLPSDEELEALSKRLNLSDLPRRGSGDFAQFHQGWGHRSGRISQIVTMIEELQNFY